MENTNPNTDSEEFRVTTEGKAKEFMIKKLNIYMPQNREGFGTLLM